VNKFNVGDIIVPIEGHEDEGIGITWLILNVDLTLNNNPYYTLQPLNDVGEYIEELFCQHIDNYYTRAS
jgi:hypothetical protein